MPSIYPISRFKCSEMWRLRDTVSPIVHGPDNAGAIPSYACMSVDDADLLPRVVACQNSESGDARVE